MDLKLSIESMFACLKLSLLFVYSLKNCKNRYINNNAQCIDRLKLTCNNYVCK